MDSLQRQRGIHVCVLACPTSVGGPLKPGFGLSGYSKTPLDGHTENVDARAKTDMSSRGEFEVFRGIFSPKANAEFKWDHDAIENGKRQCVFRYDVSRANSMLSLGIETRDDRQTLAHHGFIYADCESGAITRVQIESELGSTTVHGRKTAIGLELDMRYRPVTIGDREFFTAGISRQYPSFGHPTKQGGD